jgi:hypothetical protein
MVRNCSYLALLLHFFFLMHYAYSYIVS